MIPFPSVDGKKKKDLQDSLDLGYIFYVILRNLLELNCFLFLQMCIDKYFCIFVTVRPIYNNPLDSNRYRKWYFLIIFLHVD